MSYGSGQNLTGEIVQALGRLIVSRAFTGGGLLPVEADLCRRFGASRSVLREAVKVLTAKGLLQTRPRKGTWILDPDNWSLFDPDVFVWLLESGRSAALLQDFTLIRLAIEPEAAAITASSASYERKMAVFVAATRDATDDDGYELVSTDIAFHLAVLQASGNRFYEQMGKLIEVAWRANRRGHVLGSRDTAAGRRRVADAILAADARTAEASMRNLIVEASCVREQPKKAMG